MACSPGPCRGEGQRLTGSTVTVLVSQVSGTGLRWKEKGIPAGAQSERRPGARPARDPPGRETSPALLPGPPPVVRDTSRRADHVCTKMMLLNVISVDPGSVWVSSGS